MILRAEAFEPWRCDRTCQLGIHLEHMNKVLKCMGGKDELEVKYKDGGDECDFVFKSPDEDKATVNMSSGEFQRICRDLAVLGDTLTIGVNKDSVQFSVAGEIGKGEMTLRSQTASDDQESTDIDCREPVVQTFAMRYLNFFTKATVLSKSVRLSMSPEVPLLVEYAIDEIGYVRYYLAPKIEED